MEWISVEDRLPKISQMYLCYMNYKIPKVLYFVDGYFTEHNSTRWVVSHWMPLPEPPKQ